MQEKRELSSANGTPESASAVTTRKITNVPENLKGIFNLREKELLEIVTPGQNRMLVYGGSGGGIDFADLRELLKKQCQLEISLNVNFPKGDAGKSRVIIKGKELANNQPPPAIPIEEALTDFQKDLEREKTALEGLKEKKPSAEKFAKEVIAKNVYGKLSKGVIIDGVQIGRDSDSRGANDFGYYGPDKTLRPEDNVRSLVNLIYGYEDKFPELINSHIVSIAPSSPDAVNSILTIHFFQDRKAPDSRGYYTPAFVQVKLPDKAAGEFLSEISINPDLLEEFYQKVFVGLDSKEGNPGMRRAKADGFYLITNKNLEEVRKACREYDPITGYDQDKRIRTLFQKLGKHQYKNGPYGTGDALQNPTQERSLDFPVIEGMEELYQIAKQGTPTIDQIKKALDERSMRSKSMIFSFDSYDQDKLKKNLELCAPFANLITTNEMAADKYSKVLDILEKKVSRETVRKAYTDGISMEPEAWSEIFEKYFKSAFWTPRLVTANKEFSKYYFIFTHTNFFKKDPLPRMHEALGKLSPEEIKNPEFLSIFKTAYEIESIIDRFSHSMGPPFRKMMPIEALPLIKESNSLDELEQKVTEKKNLERQKFLELKAEVEEKNHNAYQRYENALMQHEEYVQAEKARREAQDEFMGSSKPEAQKKYGEAKDARDQAEQNLEKIPEIAKLKQEWQLSIAAIKEFEKEVALKGPFGIKFSALQSPAGKEVQSPDEEKRFAETAEAKKNFLKSVVDPVKKQKMGEIFDKIVEKWNQLTPEDMDLWAEQNEYKMSFIGGLDFDRYIGTYSRISGAEKALLSKESLSKFKKILTEQDIGKNGKVRTALLVEFIHRPPANEKDLIIFNEFAEILKRTKKQFKDYDGYMNLISGLRSTHRGPDDTVEKIIEDLDRTNN